VVFSWSSGPGTPIYVRPATLRTELEKVGFDRFEELAAGSGTGAIARRR
jgi:hypothetical protein